MVKANMDYVRKQVALCKGHICFKRNIDVHLYDDRPACTLVLVVYYHKAMVILPEGKPVIVVIIAAFADNQLRQPPLTI